jgi:phosphoglycerol transferase
VLLVAIPAIFVVLLLRNSGLYPVVMADEWEYSTLSRLLPFASAYLPNYAYMAIFSLTNSCGDGFLSCARIVNAVAFVAAAPFIYLIARRVCTQGVAALVTVLALAGPINTYTAYFMPEALYFLAFWVLAWFILGLDGTSSRRMWIIAGILLGVAALVKPHALFLLPAILAYVLYISNPNGRDGLRSAVWSGILLVLAALLVKFAVGYLLAGSAGVTLFGSTYSSVAGSALSDVNQASHLLTVSAQSVMGHLLAICLMYGLPIAISATVFVRSLRPRGQRGAEERTAAFALLVVADLVVAVALFTAAVNAAAPSELATRLHMRYYDFALPLFFMVVGAQLTATGTRRASRWSALAVVAIGAAIVYALVSRMQPYVPSLVDNPELAGFTANPLVFMALGLLSLGSLVLWTMTTRWGPRLFVYGFLPLAVVLPSVAISVELDHRQAAAAVDRAGMFTRSYLPHNELARVLVVGSDPAALFMALFYLDNPQPSLQVIPPGSNYDLSTLPQDKDWALIIGDHQWTGGSFFESSPPGFALVRRDNPAVNVDFTLSGWPGVVSRTQGLSTSEAWGTWSSGDVVTIEFASALPERFELHLNASAFGPNVGKEFVARVGTEEARFTLGASPEERVLQFHDPGLMRTIEIDVPAAVSPMELGLSSDPRRVGIGLVSLGIVPLPPNVP